MNENIQKQSNNNITTTTTTATKQQQKITKCFNRIKRFAKRGNILIKLLGKQQSYANTKVRAKSFNLIYVMFSFFWVLLECIKSEIFVVSSSKFIMVFKLWIVGGETRNKQQQPQQMK